MFFYMLETHTWLSMHYYSWSFLYVTFHVITWLLSFIVKIMSFMPMFRVLWSQHSMLYIVWSRLCSSMSPQKLLFCYHLPTRGRAGVKIGDAWYVSKASIIFDAPCLFMHHLPFVLLRRDGGGGRGQPHHGAYPWPAPPGGGATWPTSWRCPSAYIFSSMRKP
jgi:hypothetical protein